MAAAAVGLALLGPRLIAVHGPDVSRSVLIGGWWIALAFLGIAGFFVAVAVGALLGIDEDDAGVFALLPMLSMAFGLLSMTPAAAMAAVGTARAGVIAWWGVAALWTVTPLLVMLLVYGGFAEGTAEKVGASLFLAVFAISWVVVGASLKSANVASTADAA